jgi:hypothetical protein
MVEGSCSSAKNLVHWGNLKGGYNGVKRVERIVLLIMKA